MSISVVTFDGDQTLWDFQKAMRAALAETITFLQDRVTAAGVYDLTVEHLIRTRDQVAEQVEGSHELIRKLSFQRILEELGLKDAELTEQLFELYMERRFSLIELYPDTKETLRALSARYMIGLISNGNTYPHRCGLADYFNFTVFSDQVGAKKPHWKPFAHAARCAGCPVSEIAHVGDQLSTDVVGAKSAGATAIWLNREGRSCSTEIMVDYEIRSLSELIVLLLPGGA